ncbi:MAG TPA: hypothetical protein VH120_07890 [Gemmataceae bacterium]|jgi:hypothetical protein|nr:hypothetical protein [Gemmataceae bacterium]
MNGRWNDEPIAFWLIAVLHLVPVWAFRYLPTQDGPSHLNNAQILKDYGNPATGYQQIFELRNEPLPNLTSHVLLAGFMFVVPPLAAEKLLVSLYVLGFAGSFRYFLGAFGERCGRSPGPGCSRFTTATSGWASTTTASVSFCFGPSSDSVCDGGERGK